MLPLITSCQVHRKFTVGFNEYRKQSELSGDVGKFEPVSCDPGNASHHLFLQHQDHEGLIGHAVVLAPDPETRCGNEAELRVITGMAQDNKDLEVRKL